jgi:S-methylmethionine-dependent homocysteine/selenocysteine methylase
MKKIFKAKPLASANRSQRRLLAGGDLESALVKDYHVDLTHNAAFELLYSREGRLIMKQYHEFYLQLAEQYQLTYILETPTWRANRDWIYRLGYNSNETANVNRHAVQFIRETQHSKQCDVIISGSVGPRRDDSEHSNAMSAEESEEYHSEQIRTFALLDVDIITARAFNDSREAIGVVNACRAVGVPVALSFNVDGVGNLTSGESLAKAISQVDEETRHYASYYTLHCASRVTLEVLASQGGDWNERLHGIHELTQVPTQKLPAIKEHFPNLAILGGCGFNFSSLDEQCRKFSTE